MHHTKKEENDKFNIILKKAGFETFTPFQQKLIETASSHKHIIAEIKKGCGKTFGIILSVIINRDVSFTGVGSSKAAARSAENAGLKSLIITSSYESAEKINTLFKKLFQKKVTSLQTVAANPDRNIKKDSRMLKKEPDIFISTADSIIDQIRSNNISLENIQSCIIEDSDVDDYFSFEKDVEFILSKLSGNSGKTSAGERRFPANRQLFIIFTKDKKHDYSFYQFFKKPITINCNEAGEKKIMDNSFMQNIVSEIKEASDLKNLIEIKKIIKKNVPFFTRIYFSAWLLKKYAEQNGYNILANDNEKKTEDFKTIFINIGKSRRLFAKDIAGMILASKKAEKSDLKRIKVFDSYSFIDVTSSKAEDIINVINSVTFKGKKLSADYAKKQQT